MRNLDAIEGLSLILAKRHAISTKDMAGLIKSFNHQDDVSFENFLLEEGVVDKSDLLEALSEYYGVPQCDVVGGFIEHRMAELIPKDVLIRHLMIPWERDGDTLWVVAAEPNDPHLPVILAKYVTHNIEFMVGLPEDILEAIEEFYDRSNTYQPNDIANRRMERSSQDVHSVKEEVDHRVPLEWEETDDDYESK